MKIDTVEKHFTVDKIIYHSLEQALYQASVIIDGVEHAVEDAKGKRITTRNLLELQKKFTDVNCDNHVLRHESPYDEMIGGAEKGDNAMEVPIGNNGLY